MNYRHLSGLSHSKTFTLPAPRLGEQLVPMESEPRSLPPPCVPFCHAACPLSPPSALLCARGLLWVPGISSWAPSVPRPREPAMRWGGVWGGAGGKGPRWEAEPGWACGVDTPGHRGRASSGASGWLGLGLGSSHEALAVNQVGRNTGGRGRGQRAGEDGSRAA